MSSTVGDSAPVTGTGDRLGLKPGMVVQELGWDNDTDDELRVAVEDCIDADMVALASDRTIVLHCLPAHRGEEVDGAVIEGQSKIDQSLITGETLPVKAGPGTSVYAGTLNLSGALRVRVSAASEGTLLAEIGRLLDIIEQRCLLGTNGAEWFTRRMRDRSDLDRYDALRATLEARSAPGKSRRHG